MRINFRFLILVISVLAMLPKTASAANGYQIRQNINKMDRDNADFRKAMASVQEFSPVRLIPFQLPWGEKAAFKGVIDLVTMRAYANEGKTAEEIPADLKPAAEEARTALMEAAAEGDDALIEKYFADGKLNDEELAKGLKAIVRSGSYIPVFVTAGSHEKGVLPLLDAVIELTLERNRDLLKRGTVLVDERDSGTEPRVLFYLEHAIRDASQVASGERRTISKRMLYVEIDASGEARHLQYARYLTT